MNRKMYLVSKSKSPSQALADQSTSKSTRIALERACAKLAEQTLKSNPRSFGFELNKMLFVSGLVQLMEKHHLRVPENLLDNTDFVPRLLEFLEQHNVSLPTENVPQFQIDTTHLSTEPRGEENG